MLVTYVQSASTTTDGTTAGTIGRAFINPVGAGKRLIACIGMGSNTGGVQKIDDTVNLGGWRPIPGSKINEPGGPQTAELWERPASKAGTPTITATLNGTYGFRSIVLIEVDGDDALLPAMMAAVVIAGVGNLLTTITVGPLLPAIDGCLFIAFMTNDNDATNHPSFGAPFTEREDPTPVSQIVGMAEYSQVVRAAQSVAVTTPAAITGTYHLIVIRPITFCPSFTDFPRQPHRDRALGVW